MTYALASFLLAFITALVAMPVLIAFSRRFGGLDLPIGDLVIHKHPIPRVGGLGIVLAVLAPRLFILAFSPRNLESHSYFSSLPFLPAIYVWPILAGAGIAFIGGFLDDLVDQHHRQNGLGAASPLFKFIILFLASLFTVLMWYVFPEPSFAVPLLQIVICILFFFYLMGGPNSLNLLDGMDGLAGGVTVIAALALGILGMMTGRIYLALILFTLCGATFGFLLFNKPPARIFMGDGGAYFLGFVLAGCAFAMFRGTPGSLLGPILILGIPILDTLLAILRRINTRSYFTGDRAHLYDILRTRFGEGKTLLLFYTGAVVLGAAGVLIGNF
jgi:UDP-GlcNAc:undecaprenyl-phosphate GlcNAc-1-phosphate transferase